MKVAIISTTPLESLLWKDEFVRPITNIVKQAEVEYEILSYDKSELVLKGNFDKVIISGSPLGDFEAAEHLQCFNWLKEYEKPVLGVCAGMQIIGQIYGCSLKEQKEIGLIDVKTDKENPLIKGIFQAYSLHILGVDVSENFKILASSKQGPQIIKLKEKPFYGVMFHPEVRNHEIILNFLKI